jgi:hypothetical protein
MSYIETVAMAIDGLVREESPIEVVRYPVDFEGIDLNTARKAVEDARYVLKHVRGY